MCLIPPILPHYLSWDYSIPVDLHITESDTQKRKGVVITDLEDRIVLEPLNSGQLDSATEVEEKYFEEEMSLKKTDKDWDFNWIGTPECNVVITDLDEEQEVQ
ncbi:Uncharacterized protein Adt_38015 [Abeliophyllum distichum]|uniref:Uncharacterized protein n=1 Tax=Abeliophyllum distichum TaxID=126358 RepID=A0ABD1Q113_9LAMI